MDDVREFAERNTFDVQAVANILWSLTKLSIASAELPRAELGAPPRGPDSLTRSLARSLTHSLAHSLTRSLTRSITRSGATRLWQPPPDVLRSLGGVLRIRLARTHSLPYSLPYSLTHSLIH